MTTPLSQARRVVVKVGSALIVDAATGAPHKARLAAIAQDIRTLQERGARAALVSSGAIALGRRRLGFTGAALTLAQKQAAAAAGQTALMTAWEAAFGENAPPLAQALLTLSDTETRRRWLNARATLETLLDAGALPVINENDTVATEEIRYGDNDRLAARVSQLIGADCLILLSDVDGLHDADPRKSTEARRIARVETVTDEIAALAGGAEAKRALGTGGMATKIAAAKIAAAAGCATAIGDGVRDAPLLRLQSEDAGTWFAAAQSPQDARRHWIAHALTTAGALSLDAGAVAAVRSGKSLLAAGATRIDGAFQRGDAVRLLGPDGEEFARGLAGYDAAEARLILGKRSEDIEATLGYRRGAALVHAGDIVLTDKA